RQRQHGARDLLRDALLEQALVRLEGAERVLLDLAPRQLSNLVVDRLERVRAGLADLGAHEVRDIELGLHLRVAPGPLVVAVPRPVAVVLTDDEERRLDEEAEVAVLERAAVT